MVGANNEIRRITTPHAERDSEWGGWGLLQGDVGDFASGYGFVDAG